MSIQTYLERYRGKKLVVLGLGISNRPLVRLLCEAGLDVTACDRAERGSMEAAAVQLEGCGAKLRLGQNYLEGVEADVVFRTPVMLPTIPELRRFARQGAEISSEMQLFFELCPCKMIAITGSDGKSTTTTIIAELLRAAGHKVWLGGNLGTPLLEYADEMQPEDYAVVELSSFQLMDMKKSAPVAVVTNVTPNHLDKHTDMQEYVEAKENCFRYQSGDGKLVLNLDNEITAGFAADAAGEVIYFSRREKLTKGLSCTDGIICRDGVELLRADAIRIPGTHNIENFMAAIAAVGTAVPDEVIRTVAGDFCGIEHRMELVRTRRGVRFYNDSIASSPTRTIAGLHSFPQKLILIAGGYDKNIPFEALGPEIRDHVKVLVLCGATAGKIKQAVLHTEGELPPIYEYADFKAAVEAAAELAQPGDIVALSPACAAFDLFQNFMVRGKTFKQIVMELPE